MKDDKEVKAPNIMRMSRWSNFVSDTVTLTVVILIDQHHNDEFN